MSDRRSIHDGWTPQPQEQEQPGDPLSVSPLTILAALLHNFDPEWCRHEDGSAFGECDARAKALLFAGVTLASSPAPAGLDEATLAAAVRSEGYEIVPYRGDPDDPDYLLHCQKVAEALLRVATRPAEWDASDPDYLDALRAATRSADDPTYEKITDANGDELEHGEPDYPGQDK